MTNTNQTHRQQSRSENPTKLCREVCPCCKQRHCLQAEGHREHPLTDKRFWHRCTSSLCAAW